MTSRKEMVKVQLPYLRLTLADETFLPKKGYTQDFYDRLYLKMTPFVLPYSAQSLLKKEIENETESS